MYSRAAKQIDKLSQRVGEKVFNNQKTALSDDFKDFEAEIEMRRSGVERLHATSIPFHTSLTKLKPSPDPEASSSKDKILSTEALGLVMISYGERCAQSGVSDSGYAEALQAFGRARCKLAVAQEEFGHRIGVTYIAGMDAALDTVKDYSTHRKKLDSRRLALDAAINKQNSSKKESRALEADVETAQARFEETEEDVHQRMINVQSEEGTQFGELTEFLEAELEYFRQCQDILENVRRDWPGYNEKPPSRPRAKSSASGTSTPVAKTRPRGASRASQLAQQSDDEVGGRPRSHSTASTGSAKGKRSMMPSFGSFGKKSASRTFSKDKYGSIDSKTNLAEGSDEEYDRPASPTSSFGASGRSRSQNSLAMMNATRGTLSQNERPPMRRTHTTPHANARLVKALFDFPGDAADELRLRVGQVVEIKSEVNGDWYIGESDGKSGLFPSSYTEEYVPTPTTAVPPRHTGEYAPATRAVPPPMPSTNRPRNLPPPPPSTQNLHIGSPSTTEDESENESIDRGYSDTEQNMTAPLASGMTDSTGHLANQRYTPQKKAAPPPPPSRRTQSSTNGLGTTPTSSYLGTGMLMPPQPAYRRDSDGSNEGSPFGGSDEESRGCDVCGCDEFTHNLFKPNSDTCSSCFHPH